MGRNDIYYTILRLRDGVDREEINRQIYKAMQKYYPDSADDEWRNFYDAQPLPEIHLDDSNTHSPLHLWFWALPYFCGNHELCISSYCYHEPQGKKYRCA